MELFITKNSSTFRIWTAWRECMVGTFPLLRLCSCNSDLGIKNTKIKFKKLWERTTQLPLLFQYASTIMIYFPKCIHCFFLFFNPFSPQAAIYIQLSNVWKILKQASAQPANWEHPQWNGTRIWSGCKTWF